MPRGLSVEAVGMGDGARVAAKVANIAHPIGVARGAGLQHRDTPYHWAIFAWEVRTIDYLCGREVC